MDTYAYDAGLPCKNPNCTSHGRPHPNCKCYSGGGSEALAKGGEVSFCSESRMHEPGCEYYASGGDVAPIGATDSGNTPPQENPHFAVGHATVHHGLLGMLTNVGKSKLAEPEKHKRILEDAHDHMSRMKNPVPGAEPKRTVGVRLALHLSAGEHDKAADLMQGHPLVGSMGQSNLKDVMGRLSQPIMNNEPHPDSMRTSADYLHSAVKGHTALESKASDMLGGHKSDELIPSKKDRDLLKDKLSEFSQNPEKMLDVAGHLGHYMPEHAAGLSAMTATAVDYLNSIKPKPQQMAPLDEPMPPDKAEEYAYDRQLDIAQQPMLLLDNVKSGTLLPQDMHTVQTIYPGLWQSILDKANEALITAKTDGIELPYKQKQTLSMLLGQPLDSTQTPMAMQAIMRSQGEQQAQQQAKKSPKKATSVELKQINKVDAMYALPTEARQIDKKA